MDMKQQLVRLMNRLITNHQEIKMVRELTLQLLLLDLLFMVLIFLVMLMEQQEEWLQVQELNSWMENDSGSPQGPVTCGSWIRRPENLNLVVLRRSRRGNSSPSFLQIFSFDPKTISISTSPLDWSGQDINSIASEICGFITVLTGTIILHGTKEHE